MKNEKTKSVSYYQIIGWNIEGEDPIDRANASSLYEDFRDARKQMIKFVKEDRLEDCIDGNINLKDPDLDCITIDNGIRGYYIEDVVCVVKSSGNRKKVK